MYDFVLINESYEEKKTFIWSVLTRIFVTFYIFMVFFNINILKIFEFFLNFCNFFVFFRVILWKGTKMK